MNISNIATVTIEVAENLYEVLAYDREYETLENTPVAATLDAADEENEVLSYTVTAAPQFGVLSGTAPELEYLPAAGFVGTDQFTFTASDGEHSSAPATVTIQVHAAYCGVSNTAPVFQAAVDEIEIVLPAGPFVAQEAATFLAVDAEGGVTYSLGAGGDLFAIDPQTGVLQLIAAPPLGGDLEMDAEVIATDECGKETKKPVKIKIMTPAENAASACHVESSSADYDPRLLAPDKKIGDAVDEHYLYRDEDGAVLLETGRKIKFNFGSNVTDRSKCVIVQWRLGHTFRYDTTLKTYDLDGAQQYNVPGTLPARVVNSYSEEWTIDSADTIPEYSSSASEGDNWKAVIDRPGIQVKQGFETVAEQSFQTCVYEAPLTTTTLVPSELEVTRDGRFPKQKWHYATIEGTAVYCTMWNFAATAAWPMNAANPQITHTGFDP